MSREPRAEQREKLSLCPARFVFGKTRGGRPHAFIKYCPERRKTINASGTNHVKKRYAERETHETKGFGGAWNHR